MQKEKALAYVDSQKSLHLYHEAKDAFVDVLSVLPLKDFETVTQNLLLMTLHEGAIGQVMHFEPHTEKFQVLQLTIPAKISPQALRWVIAHELGHVMQKRNWEPSDGEMLEHDAEMYAARWGFKKTNQIQEEITAYRAQFGVY